MIATLSSKELDARVRKIWGNVGRGTPEEKLATMRRFNNDLRAAPGDVKAGIRIYNQVCARCHKLYGSGGELGMDLTNSNRKDRNYLLTQIVDPSVYIRKEYMSYEVHTTSGRVVSGLMVEQDGASVTLIDADYRKTRIPRSDLAELKESECLDHARRTAGEIDAATAPRPVRLLAEPVQTVVFQLLPQGRGSASRTEPRP